LWAPLCLSLVDLRRTEQLEAQAKDPTGSLGACLLAPVLMGHVLAMVPPTSKSALYRALR